MTEKSAPITVVTGASGALGGVLLSHLSAAGHRVAAIERVAARLPNLASANVLPILLDESSDAPWANALAQISRELGTPTGAVLAAGGWAGGARLTEPAASTNWSKMLEQNLETARAALSALLPAMVRARRGSIVLVGSRAALRPWESGGAAAYAASKAAALAFAQAAAAEVLEDGVRVNAVLPSSIDTPSNRRAMPDADASRWVTPESLAYVIEFLLSDAARDISGAALPVYGRS